MEDGSMPDQQSPAAPPRLSTHSMGESISASMKRLSLSAATATALPPSSPISSPAAPLALYHNVADRSNLTAPAPYLKSTTSGTSSAERSFTPTLSKKTSLSSLQGPNGATSPRSPAIRRVPSNLSSTTAMTSRSSLPPPAEEAQAPPPPTASQFAKAHFQRELQIHNSTDSPQARSELIVILHDACYGHRFARPKTSKANLNTIVERPERIQATILGVSTAYVRLGGRHAQGSHPPSHPSPADITNPIPFSIRNSSRVVSLVSPAVTQVHGAKWMAELKMMCEGAEAKLALNGKELVRPECLEEDNEKPKLHEGDLYLCSESLNALEGALGGVCDAVDAVFDSTTKSKRAFVCVRPPGHHCSADYPSGFCWLNNVHVGISHASITHGLTHAAIIDFDLHHGDGSQAITWQHNRKLATLPKNTPTSKRTAIGYFSLHDINSYPCEWGDEEKVQNASLCLENAHGQTIWNVHLQPWKSDLEFWELYNERYSILLSKMRKFLQNHNEKLQSSLHSPQPKAAIFISAGFDASEWESPGMQRHKVNVPTEFYARFTSDINDIADEEGLGVEGRVISVLEGGYSDRALMSGVLSHICGLSNTTAAKSPMEPRNGLAQEMGRRLGRLSIEGDDTKVGDISPGSVAPVDQRWWALPRLEELEAVVHPAASLPAPKKARSNAPPTYTTSTQSFTAKIVSPSANRRASSNSYRQRSASSASSRAPTPPPPDVDWTIAANELCKLLIPSNRQTESCKVEELNAEATRVRRNRQSNIGLPVEMPAIDAKGMQLRDRRAKVPAVKTEPEEARPASRANRRKTIAGEALKLDGADQRDIFPRTDLDSTTVPARRRLSVASTLLSTNDDFLREAGSEQFQRIQNSGPNGFPTNRPPSSLSVHKDTSTTDGPALPLIKKTRAPAKPKLPSQAAAVRRQSVQPSLPRIPSAFSTKPKPTETEAVTSSVSSRGQDSPQQTGPSGHQDLDQLASGMKKMNIKLNVRPKEGSETKEKKPKSAPKLAKKVAVGKPAKKLPISTTPQESQPAPDLVPMNPVNPQTALEIVPVPTTIASPTEARSVPTEVQAPVELPAYLSTQDIDTTLPPSFMAPVSAPVLAPSAEIQPSVFEEATYQELSPRDTQPMSVPSSHTNPSSLYAPVILPSTPKRTKQDLPVFTATSPIIFGQPSLSAASLNHHVNGHGSKAANTTPDRKASTPVVGSTSSTMATTNPLRNVPKLDELSKCQQEDIWGVPETPQQRML